MRARAGCVGAVVEGVEVVVDGLDLGAFHDREAEPEEDVFQLAAGAGEDVQVPDRLRRGARERDVHLLAGEVAVELLRRQRLGARVDQRLERPACLVGGLADLGPLRGLELGHAAQQLRQLGLAPELADPQLGQLFAARRPRRSPARPARAAAGSARS